MAIESAEITAEQVWKVRERVYGAARANPSYRPDPPRLDDMDSLDALSFSVELEEKCDVHLTDEEIEKLFGGLRVVEVKDLGRIADYIADKMYGGEK